MSFKLPVINGAPAVSWTEFAHKLVDVPSSTVPQVDESTEEELRLKLSAALKTHKSKRDPVGGEGAALNEERCRILAMLSDQEREDFLKALEMVESRQKEKIRAFKKEAEVSISRAEKPADAKRARMLTRLLSRPLEKDIETLGCEFLQKEISSIVRAANHFNITPMEVTGELKQRYYLELSTQSTRELLADFCGKGAKSTKRKKSVKKTTKAKTEPQPFVASGSTPVEKKVEIQPTNPKMNMFDVRRKDKDLTEHTRVTARWQSKDPAALRKITDMVDGSPTRKYAEMDDIAVLEQRSFHFLPGVEKLIAFQDARQKYTFKTETGYGIIAQLICEDKVHEGIIYFGVDERNRIYHKYFKKLAANEAIFSGIKFEDESVLKDSEGRWQPVRKCLIQNVDNECLEIYFKGEEHKLRIYPI